MIINHLQDESLPSERIGAAMARDLQDRVEHGEPRTRARLA